MTAISKPSPLRIDVCGSAGDGKRSLVGGLARGVPSGRILVVGDAPGEPDMRSLADGAAPAASGVADVSVVLVDAQKGVQVATRRHGFLAALLGVRQVVLAVNKMDLVGYSQATFTRIESQYRALAAELGLPAVACVPVSALTGDNVLARSAEMPWYQGPTLADLLDRAESEEDRRRREPARPPAETADQFEASIVWLGPSPLLPGRGYLIKVGGDTATATVAPLKYRINPNDSQRMAAANLRRNQIGVCGLQLDHAVAFDPYRVNRDTGGFVLLDPRSGDTLGVGMLHFALRRAQNLRWQQLAVDKKVRAAAKGQKPCVLWYTGLSGAGKSTIANLVDSKLHSLQRHTYLLDGDNVRHGLNRDLGFTDADRVENIRRIGEVAKLMVDAGLIVGTAFISPFRAERQTARALLAQGEFIEVFIDTPLAIAEGRDPKGLYKKARRGDLKNFTGIDSPYEVPENPEIRVDTTAMSPEAAAEMIVGYLRARGMLEAS